MKLLMYGVNRDSVSSDEIHKYSLDDRTRTLHLKDISSFEGVKEVVLLVTENRNEYYLYVDEKQFKHGDLLRYLSHYTGKTLEEVIIETYSKFNDDVVKHLLTVSSNVETASNQTFEPIEVIDNALMEAIALNTVGTVLYKLFKTVVDFSLSIYEKESIEPLLQSEIYRSIRFIKNSIRDKKSSDYLIIGHHPISIQIMKHLIGESDSSVTFIDRTDYAIETTNSIRQWLDMMNQPELMNNVSSVDMKQLLYRLSKADVVIIGPCIKHSWISDELLEEMQKMRPNAKKQLVFDFSVTQDETVFSNYKYMEYRHINDEPKKMFPKEKLDEALSAYDELLTDYTTRYMNSYSQLQEEETSGFHYSKNESHFMNYAKKICHRA